MKHFGTSRSNDTPFFQYAYENKAFSYCVFASLRSIDLMKKNIDVGSRKLMIDATFKVCPNSIFNQLLIIYVEYFTEVVPLAFVLMSRKTQASYAHVFNYIHRNIFDMTCASIMTDFESAMRNALRALLPTVPITGCWFHYSQALRRRASSLKDFVQWINCNKSAGTTFRRFFYLPLLRSTHIAEAFRMLKAESSIYEHKMFNEFVAYIEKQWINRVRNLFWFMVKIYSETAEISDFHAKFWIFERHFW